MKRSHPVVQFALLAGPLLSMLDSSIVNVAVAPIARELRAPLTTVQWAVSGYLLALGAGLAATAFLARRYGTIPVYAGSILLFTVASALCAAAPDAYALAGARVLQGLVAAPLVPLAMSMLLGTSGNARNMSPVAGIMLFLGPALGPTIGGALIGAWGWRSIFLVNVPIGLLAALATRRVPAAMAPGPTDGARFDLPGMVLLAGGLTGLLYGASQGAVSGWAGTGTLAALAGGGALMACYGLWARRREQPALDLSLLRQAVPALSMALCAVASIAGWAAVFLLPVFLQTVQGRSALDAGLVMAPQGVVTGVSTILGVYVLGRFFTVRTTVAAGFAVLAVASLGLLLINASTPLWATGLILACRAADIGVIINPLLQVMTAHLKPDELSDANTLFNAIQRVAASFGIGLVASLYASTARTQGPVAALHLTGLIVVAISGAGAVAALALPATRDVTAHLRRPAAVRS
ncbi:MAG TPA: DHA2 family efflux MFS transporter permease subunit [Streptosporangiaceae bacterium]|nr:DHA2 family efflux MFS transporter permease subunit [Streptosporangiaceae bacterium]